MPNAPYTNAFLKICSTHYNNGITEDWKENIRKDIK